MENLNFCEELLNEFKRQEIDERIINIFINSDQYRNALDKSSSIQRSLLTSILFRILLMLKVRLPAELRLQLTIDTDNNDWLVTMKNSIIPFIKLNCLNLINELNERN